MSDQTELQVAEVRSAGPASAECIVRCLSGIARPGDLFILAGESRADAAPPIVLQWIECYGSRREALELSYTAKIRLSGGAVSALQAGSRITSAAP